MSSCESVFPTGVECSSASSTSSISSSLSLGNVFWLSASSRDSAEVCLLGSTELPVTGGSSECSRDLEFSMSFLASGSLCLVLGDLSCLSTSAVSVLEARVATFLLSFLQGSGSTTCLVLGELSFLSASSVSVLVTRLAEFLLSFLQGSGSTSGATFSLPLLLPLLVFSHYLYQIFLGGGYLYH